MLTRPAPPAAERLDADARPLPPGWAHALPGYGASRVLVDGALTPTFDEWASLGIALAWLLGLLFAVGLLFLRSVPRARRSTHTPAGPARTAAVPA